jgi:hypothetical protein
MKIHVNTKDRELKEIIVSAVTWYANKLMSARMVKSLSITIKLKKNLSKKDGDEGRTSWEDSNHRPKEFTIEVDANISTREILEVLAHEMVHVKQFATGELFQYFTGKHKDLMRWHGQVINNDVEYWDQPWEIEAYGMQLGLITRWFDATISTMPEIANLADPAYLARTAMNSHAKNSHDQTDTITVLPDWSSTIISNTIN